MSPLVHEIHPCNYVSQLPEVDWHSRNLALSLLKGSPWSYELEWRVVRRTIRPAMRLLGTVLHDNYNRIHSDNSFSAYDHVEWSRISSEIAGSMESTYNTQRVLAVRPTRVILGVDFSRNYSNEGHATKCREIIVTAREQGITILRVATGSSSYNLNLTEMPEGGSSWWDFHPELKKALGV